MPVAQQVPPPLFVEPTKKGVLARVVGAAKSLFASKSDLSQDDKAIDARLVEVVQANVTVADGIKIHLMRNRRDAQAKALFDSIEMTPGTRPIWLPLPEDVEKRWPKAITKTGPFDVQVLVVSRVSTDLREALARLNK
jgi:hypothetical protein